MKDLQVSALKKLIIKEMASKKNKMEEEIKEKKDAAKTCGKLVKVTLTLLLLLII